MTPIISTRNIKTFGNLYNVKVKLSYKLLYSYFLSIFITAFLGLVLIDEPLTKGLNIQTISIAILGICIYSTLNEYKIFACFIKKYIRLKISTILIIGSQSIIALYVFLSLSEFIYFAILGAIFWFSSGILRGILQLSKALFDEDPAKLVKLSQIYSFLRLGYYFSFVVLFIDIFDFKLVQEELLFFYTNGYFYELIMSLSMIFLLLFIILFMFSYCTYNLYPYIIKSQDVQTSIEIIQYISSNKKGYKFQQILTKFNDINEKKIKDYLERLTYVKYIVKDNTKYKIMPDYNSILQGK